MARCYSNQAGGLAQKKSTVTAKSVQIPRAIEDVRRQQLSVGGLGRDEMKNKGARDTERNGKSGRPPFGWIAAERNRNQGCP
jgi:hypothetical protein